MANERKISIRAGCHCNPGAREVALGYPRTLLAPCFKDKDQNSFEEFVRTSRHCRAGVVRVSLGAVSTFKDVYQFVAFARSFGIAAARVTETKSFAATAERMLAIDGPAPIEIPTAVEAIRPGVSLTAMAAARQVGLGQDCAHLIGDAAVGCSRSSTSPRSPAPAGASC